jgi:hypothetical protein
MGHYARTAADARVRSATVKGGSVMVTCVLVAGEGSNLSSKGDTNKVTCRVWATASRGRSEAHGSLLRGSDWHGLVQPVQVAG